MTPKQERFAHAYTVTGNASEAYRQAYDCQRMAPATITRKAAELLQHEKINAMIHAVKQEHRQRHNITVDNILDELEQARQKARELQNPAAMVSATMGKVRVLGLDKLVHEVGSKDGALLLPTVAIINRETVKAIMQDLENEY